MINGSATHKLFKVPELLTMICSYSGCRYSPRLLRISRAFFLAGAPFIWEKVVGVQHILELLPGVEFEAKEDPSKPESKFSRKAFSITIPPGLGEVAADFTRFDLYAQFMKRLEIYSPAVSSYHVGGNGWRQLSEQAKRRVLLPNLLELTITPPRFSKGENIFMWTRTFLSPSLISIAVEAVTPNYDLPVVPGLVAKSLLGHIEKTCHDLQRFQFFSETLEDHDASSECDEFGIADFWEPSFFERLTGLQLRKLGCTTELISPEWIHLLGEFPLLRDLDLYATHPDFADSRPVSLPYLEHFGIHSTICDEIEKVAKLGFLGGLKSLKISFRECELLMEGGWEKDVILLISQKSPGLTKLYMDFEDDNSWPQISSFRPLGPLPLAEVYLRGSILFQSDLQLEDLGAIWPNVTRFEMSEMDEDLELEALRHFTTLPRLQYLALPVSWSDGIPQSIAPAKPSCVLQIFEILTDSFYADFDVTLFAHTLAPDR
ncbi:hypothetical protein FRC09_001820 [Ceratobasidium sp. 395]|nr:hypothetical protein FRC09_001820 [Ceratobasidium sp. 395]